LTDMPPESTNRPLTRPRTSGTLPRERASNQASRARSSKLAIRVPFRTGIPDHRKVILASDAPDLPLD